MSNIETRRHENQILEISQDTDPESPREWSNLGIMACRHPEYTLGDIQLETEAQFKEHVKDAVVSLPLYLLDHSGLVMDVKPSPFDQQMWDTSMVGTIYTTDEKIKEMCGKDRPTDEKIRQQLIGEVKTYSQYLQGEVYQYTLSEITECSLGEEHKELVDSVAGYYDTDSIIAETGSQDWGGGS